jgi:glycosyltransferase involved in cell wall biosynthesis
VPELERIAVVGVSARRYCGVRDHARLLSEELRGRGIDVAEHWLNIEPGASLAAARRATLDFAAALPRQVLEKRSQALLLHYSVFAYSHRGIPVHAAALARAVRAPGVPVLAVLHEVAYPWPRRADARGVAWALSQRLAARRVIALSSAAIVTADFRAEWLDGAWWLPRRPIRVAPVFSNLPVASASPRSGTVGIFGWSFDAATVGLTVDALAPAGPDAPRLRLLGAPGPDAEAAKPWRTHAEQAGMAERLEFSGALPVAQLADELAASEVLLYVDPAGLSGRKGTLAAALASGRPVLAVAGKRAWPALESSGAVDLAPRDAASIRAALGALLGDAARRQSLADAAREFYAREMSVGHTADVALDLLAG